MQLPYRKPDKYTHLPNDPIMTGHKFAELKKEVEQLKAKQPHAAKEVARLAELGDFSENVEYQLAKRRLRGINNAILKIEHQLNAAQIIETDASDVVAIGSTVTVEVNGKEKTYTILGSSETDPSKNIISYTSPLGSALLGTTIEETILLKMNDSSKSLVVKKIV